MNLRLMHHIALVLLSGISLMSSATNAAIRSFAFDAQVKYAPLLNSLPNHTAIYHEWPPEKLRKTLPNYVSAALIESAGSNESGGSGGGETELPLIGPPIHVQAGDTISYRSP